MYWLHADTQAELSTLSLSMVLHSTAPEPTSTARNSPECEPMYTTQGPSLLFTTRGEASTHLCVFTLHLILRLHLRALCGVPLASEGRCKLEGKGKKGMKNKGHSKHLSHCSWLTVHPEGIALVSRLTSAAFYLW